MQRAACWRTARPAPATGPGGDGGHGGPGRGGDAIGIAYLDEDRLTVEGVTSAMGLPGKGGMNWDDQATMIAGVDGVAVETLRCKRPANAIMTVPLPTARRCRGAEREVSGGAMGARRRR
ncbi:hypothetical protein [Sorangium sp. So ce176]|uniref:hypothetical protein n=1 Tax=Sorangium sp. So ce176 TaxID=3133286 RepID=UPI003F5F759B